MSVRLLIAAVVFAALPAPAQEEGAPTPAPATPAADVTVGTGTKVPLSLINSISTKHSAEGDSVYLETAYPVVVNGRVIIPVGSYVMGTVTQIKKPGRMKGRGELYIRFASLTLPNGVTHDFRGALGGLDSAGGESLDRAEGSIKGKGGIGNDAKTVMTAAGAGGMAGAAAGGIATVGQDTSAGRGNNINSNWYRRPVIGGSIGMAAGATAGLVATLFMRGPDAVLTKGTDLDMVLDRSVTFQEADLAGLPAPPPGARQAPAEPSLRQR